MSYSLTLGQVRNSSIRNVAGVCANSDEFAELVNEVTRRLMRRGGWWETEVLMRLCAYGCHIVWPRVVGTVLGLRFRCAGTALIKNQWWAIHGYGSCGWRSDAIARDDGTRPCYNEVTGNTGKYIKYHIVKSEDVGKTIRLFGLVYGNQPLQERDADGNWIMGLTLTATQAGVQSTVLVTKITSIVRDATQGRGFLYEVDPTTGDLHDLAMFEPSETNPAYRCSVVQNWSGIGYTTDSYERQVRQIEALVKLAFVPAVSDDDFVMLDNLDALKAGVQAIKLEEANDDAGAEAKWVKSIRELNFDLRDKNPRSQIVVQVNSISSDYPICQPI